MNRSEWEEKTGIEPDCVDGSHVFGGNQCGLKKSGGKCAFSGVMVTWDMAKDKKFDGAGRPKIPTGRFVERFGIET